MASKKNKLSELLELEESRSCAWRFQPAGATLAHTSMSYSSPDPMAEGVWVFASLGPALQDLHDQSGDGPGYATDISRAGKTPELVAVCGAEFEDGPESYQIAHGGKIAARFSANKLRKDPKVVAWLRREGWIEED